jgi:hypothetical protein
MAGLDPIRSGLFLLFYVDWFLVLTQSSFCWLSPLSRNSVAAV